MDRNLDVGDAETKPTGGAILVEEGGYEVQVVDRVRVDDRERLLEEGIGFIAVLDRFGILVDCNGGKICVGLN
jgi:hypothetical protein